MNNNAKKNLLFFFSDESCPEALAAVPTLAFLAKNKGIDFETYICKSSGTSLNSTLPFTGHLHGEEFAHIANFYNEIYFTSLTEHKTFQFRRQILAWGGKIVSFIPGHRREVTANPEYINNINVLIKYLEN